MTLPSDIFHGRSYDPRKHWERVKQLHVDYKLNNSKACEEHTLQLLGKICDKLGKLLGEIPMDVVAETIYALYEYEDIYFLRFPDFRETLDPDFYRDILSTDEERLSSAARLSAADDCIRDLFLKLVREHAPAAIYDDAKEGDLGVPLIALTRNPALLILNIIVSLGTEYAPDHSIFTRTRTRLNRNLVEASGQTPEKVNVERFKWPTDSDLEPVQMVYTYLRDTPFVDLLLMPVPFDIPFRTRFEHHWIVAPPGAGKSTTLQYLINRDLELVAANKASIVVMESNRDLIKAIEGLKIFAPGQRLDGRLVTIDAEDVEWPIALNLFDIGIDQSGSYSAADQEAFRNSVLSLYDYIFSALLSAEMTSRQHTLFHFTIELLLSIPSATLDTLIDLMQPNGLKQFENYLHTLDHDAQRFFQLKFNSPEFNRTKEQVVDRLFAVKRIRTLSRMFSAPKSKLDFFTEMGSGKVILINVPLSLLQEDGVEITGRFFISMILLAAHKRQLLPKEQRLPCFVYIDECQDFIKRDPKIPAILDQARKLNVGLILAHQRLQQLQPSVLDALYGATSIKFATQISDAAAHALARDMRTTPEFILNQPPFHFAAHIRGLTETALSVAIPATDMNAMPRMTEAERRTVRQRIRDRYAISRESPGADKVQSARTGAAPSSEEPPAAGDDWRS
jgi:hypothetical protein